MATEREVTHVLNTATKYQEWFLVGFMEWLTKEDGISVYDSFAKMADIAWYNHGQKAPLKPIASVRGCLAKMRYDRPEATGKHRVSVPAYWGADLARLYALCNPERVRMFKYQAKKAGGRKDRFVWFHENVLFPTNALDPV